VNDFVIFPAGMSIDLADDIPLEALLVNTPDVLKNFRKYEELIQAARPSLKMLDSGGYQIFLKENKEGIHMTFNDDEEFCMTSERFNIGPRHVVDAAEQVNPDIAVALDFPIRKLTGYSGQRAEFYMKLPFNWRWALRTSEIMTQPGWILIRCSFRSSAMTSGNLRSSTTAFEEAHLAASLCRCGISSWTRS